MKIWRKLLTSVIAISLISGSVLLPVSEESTVEASTNYANLKSGITNAMLDSRMKKATSSVTVRKASSGEIVYQHYADRAVTPASTLKLLTGASALETLGDNYRFSTSVLSDGAVKSGTLSGNIYLRGQGDPTLLKKNLDSFADSLVKKGIKRVTGNLVGDDTWFDMDRLSHGILAEDEPYYYAAQISGLTISPNDDYDAGSVMVQATPSKNGKVAKVILTPETSVVQVVNSSKTVPKGYKNTLKITRELGTNKIIITGNSPIGTSGKKEWISVSNPTAYTLDVFKKSLTAKGITFSKSSKVVRGKTPINARVLVTRNSMTLKELMVPFMKLSNNTIAETLAKEMGRVEYGEGSWNAGLKVIGDYGSSIGLDMKKWEFEDASGLSYANKVSSSELSKLLYLVRSEPWYVSYVRSLPISGGYDRLVGGTLRNRLKTGTAKGNIIAKTGSLNDIKSLTGYATTRDGELLIFSVLTENARSSTIPVIDRISTAITNSTNK